MWLLHRLLRWRHLSRQTGDVEFHLASKARAHGINLGAKGRGSRVGFVHAVEDVILTRPQSELELGSRPIKVAVLAGGGLHFDPEVAAVSVHAADVVIGSRIVLRHPHNTRL